MSQGASRDRGLVRCISLFECQRNAGCASQSEVMTVAVGFSPRTRGKTEPHRVATPESAVGRAINLQASLRDAGPSSHRPVG